MQMKRMLPLLATLVLASCGQQAPTYDNASTPAKPVQNEASVDKQALLTIINGKVFDADGKQVYPPVSGIQSLSLSEMEEMGIDQELLENAIDVKIYPAETREAAPTFIPTSLQRDLEAQGDLSAQACQYDWNNNGRCENFDTVTIKAVNTSTGTTFRKSLYEVKSVCWAGTPSPCKASVTEQKSGTVTTEVNASYNYASAISLAIGGSVSTSWSVTTGNEIEIPVGGCAAYRATINVTPYYGHYTANWYEQVGLSTVYTGVRKVDKLGNWTANKPAKVVTQGWFKC